MATLSVIVGYCGSGKSKLLALIKTAFPLVCTMEEGFANPGNDGDRGGRQGILAGLRAGRDCAVGSMDCAHVEHRDKVAREVEAEAPGTRIVWVVYENDVTRCNENCARDTSRQRDVAGNVAQNDSWASGYSIPSGAVVLGVYPLPPR